MTTSNVDQCEKLQADVWSAAAVLAPVPGLLTGCRAEALSTGSAYYFTSTSCGGRTASPPPGEVLLAAVHVQLPQHRHISVGGAPGSAGMSCS
jgi:hypothetical protein